MRELIRPETPASLLGTTWDKHLAVLEAMIDHTPPGMGFLTAPGLLLSAIAWLQSQMVRLLVVKRFSAEHQDRAPHEYWYDEQHWEELFPRLRDAQQASFTPVANKFRCKFRLSEDERQALRCLQCLRNMLAHGALSPYQLEESGSPMLAYIPAAKIKNNPCHQCLGYPCADDQGGVIVSFAPDRLRTYFDELRKVGEAVGRAAAGLGIKHVDLL